MRKDIRFVVCSIKPIQTLRDPWFFFFVFGLRVPNKPYFGLCCMHDGSLCDDVTRKNVIKMNHCVIGPYTCNAMTLYYILWEKSCELYHARAKWKKLLSQSKNDWFVEYVLYIHYNHLQIACIPLREFEKKSKEKRSSIFFLIWCYTCIWNERNGTNISRPILKSNIEF